jgi:AcrR family transcriptional regulator
MSDPPVKPRRAYDSTRRLEQAAETRRRILEAALTRFAADGYGATSVAAVAREAGVSVKTVYLGFETKAGLFRAAWHLALRGERDETPVPEQAWYRALIDEPDPVRKLRRNATNSARVKERAGRLLEALRIAAESEPELAGLWGRIQVEFHAVQGGIAESLAAMGALRRDLDVAAATDLMWTLNHPVVWSLLVRERGWDAKRYEDWLADSFCRQLLEDPAGEGTADPA